MSIRYYCGDFNGILANFKEKYKSHLATPRDADVWLVFQDCQGSYRDLIKTQKKLGVNKPVYCVQHGRGSTTDYGEPNKFELIADKYLCWGQSDYDRLVSLGYKDKAAIVGCPLNVNIKPPISHPGKVILYIPVNTGKEEPENLMVYYELLKYKYGKAVNTLRDNRVALKKKWGFNNKLTVQFHELTPNCEVVAKLLPWHDQKLYHGSIVKGFQDSPTNNQTLFELLRRVDLVVGHDEGTTEIFAYGHDVPVVIVDDFKYHQHPDGRTPVEIEGYKTPAATHVTLDKLAEAVDYALAHPEHLREERKQVAEAELGISYGDATQNIRRIIKNDFKA